MNVEMPRRGDGTRIFMIERQMRKCDKCANVEIPRHDDGTEIHMIEKQMWKCDKCDECGNAPTR